MLNNQVNKDLDARRPAGVFPSLFQVFLSFLWGGNHVSIKTTLDYSGPLQVAWMRFALGILVTFSFMSLRRDSFSVSMREIRPIFIIGLLFCAQIVFMNYGQDFTTAGHATALNATYPIWAAVIAHFVVPGDALSRWRILAMVLSYSGVLSIVLLDSVIIGINSEGATVRGDILSLISAALLGSRLVLMSNFAQKISEAKIMFYQLIFGIATFFVSSYLFESPTYTLEIRFWQGLLYQGLVIAGFGFISNAWLMKRYLPSTITFFSFVNPPAGVMLSWFILGEEAGIGLLIGLAFVVAGIIVFGGESYIKTKRLEFSR